MLEGGYQNQGRTGGGYYDQDYVDDLEAPKPGRRQQQQQHYGGNDFVPIASRADEYGGGSLPTAQPIDSYELVIRHGFIRKVFGILFFQLAMTFGWTLLCTYHDSTRLYMQQNTWPLALGIALSFGSLLGMICVPHMAREYPGNYGLLGMFTIAESLLLGMVGATYKADAVAIAVGTTLAVVLALIVFASQTTYDFTGMGVYLMVGLWVMIIYGFVAALLGTSGGMVYALFGTLLFSMYIVYDVQLIIGGKHKQLQFGIDDYVIASLNIYLDVINLFLYILQLLNNNNQN